MLIFPIFGWLLTPNLGSLFSRFLVCKDSLTPRTPFIRHAEFFLLQPKRDLSSTCDCPVWSSPVLITSVISPVMAHFSTNTEGSILLILYGHRPKLCEPVYLWGSMLQDNLASILCGLKEAELHDLDWKGRLARLFRLGVKDIFVVILKMMIQ